MLCRRASCRTSATRPSTRRARRAASSSAGASPRACFTPWTSWVAPHAFQRASSNLVRGSVLGASTMNARLTAPLSERTTERMRPEGSESETSEAESFLGRQADTPCSTSFARCSSFTCSVVAGSSERGIASSASGRGATAASRMASSVASCAASSSFSFATWSSRDVTKSPCSCSLCKRLSICAFFSTNRASIASRLSSPAALTAARHAARRSSSTSRSSASACRTLSSSASKLREACARHSWKEVVALARQYCRRRFIAASALSRRSSSASVRLTMPVMTAKTGGGLSVNDSSIFTTSAVRAAFMSMTFLVFFLRFPSSSSETIISWSSSSTERSSSGFCRSGSSDLRVAFFFLWSFPLSFHTRFISSLKDSHVTACAAGAARLRRRLPPAARPPSLLSLLSLRTASLVGVRERVRGRASSSGETCASSSSATPPERLCLPSPPPKLLRPVSLLRDLMRERGVNMVTLSSTYVLFFGAGGSSSSVSASMSASSLPELTLARILPKVPVISMAEEAPPAAASSYAALPLMRESVFWIPCSSSAPASSAERRDWRRDAPRMTPYAAVKSMCAVDSSMSADADLRRDAPRMPPCAAVNSIAAVDSSISADAARRDLRREASRMPPCAAVKSIPAVDSSMSADAMIPPVATVRSMPCTPPVNPPVCSTCPVRLPIPTVGSPRSLVRLWSVLSALTRSPT
mmetsp:Transcript_43709/g.103869  ORF Transcript_43709/g.103869 Transcript_43709/m.103869 type:complete len:697 (-) Transcript_43709:1552-3642(-)